MQCTLISKSKYRKASEIFKTLLYLSLRKPRESCPSVPENCLTLVWQFQLQGGVARLFALPQWPGRDTIWQLLHHFPIQI